MKDPNMKPHFNEKKATQAAVMLLKMNGGKMNYMKLVKLLYNIDREALRRWSRPVTYDDMYSLPHGLVVSKILDKAEDSDPKIKSFWDTFIEARGLEDYLIQDPGDDELSPAEEELLKEMFERYKNKTQFDMENEHHDPNLFPEYIDPGNSSIQIYYDRVLKMLGFPEDEINLVLEEMNEQSFIEKVFA